MVTHRERIEIWLSGRKSRASEQAAIEALLAVADACDSAIKERGLSDEQISLLLGAAASKSALLQGNTIQLINWIQVLGVDAGTVVRQLFRSKRAKLRRVALACVSSGASPNSLLDELLINALSDDDKNVCAVAAHMASVHFRKKWLVPIMEPAAHLSKGVAYYQQLLKDGVVANRMPDGTYWLEVLIDSGGIRRRSISADEMERLGFDVIVNQMAECELGHPKIPVEASRVVDDNIPNPFYLVAPIYRFSAAS